MQDARVRAALISICLFCLLGSGAVLYLGHRAAPPPVIITPAPAEATEFPAPPVPSGSTSPATSPQPAPAARIYVDVAGAVRHPSLYTLAPNSRVMQAIAAAGGPVADADLDAVNLAQKLADGEKIYVPKRGTAPTAALAPPESSPAAASLPGSNLKAGKPTSTSHSSKLTADSGQQVALNTATAEDLERLPGVGPAMAGRILAFRAQAGGFSKVEDLMQVTGIGPKKFAKIAPCVRLN